MLNREVEQSTRGRWRWYLRDPELNNKSFAQSSQSYATEEDARKSFLMVEAELAKSPDVKKVKMLAALMVGLMVGFLFTMFIFLPANAQELKSLLM